MESEARAKDDFRVGFVLMRSVRPDEDSETCLHEEKANDPDATIFMINNPDTWTDKSFKHTIDTPGDYHLYMSFCQDKFYFNVKVTVHIVFPLLACSVHVLLYGGGKGRW